MSQLLLENPLLLLFVIAALGYLFGSIQINGNGLGVAAVLFVGLFFGAWNPEFEIPAIVFSLGIVLFVYSIGLNSGPAFFSSIQKNGLRDILFSIAMLTIMAAMTGGAGYLLNMSKETIVGIYTGSTTNTPALAGVLNYISERPALAGDGSMVENAVVAYSYTYPMGVIGGLLAIVLMEKIFRINYDEEVENVDERYFIESRPVSATVLVAKDNMHGVKLRDLKNKNNWNVVFGRIYRDDFGFFLSNWDTILQKGDQIMVVGSQATIDEVTDTLGIKEDRSIAYDRKDYDVRTIFVSNHHVVGQSISSLNLYEKYDAVITRIRRGDAEILATSETVLELGDRIMVVAHRDDLERLCKYFGDSYYNSSKVNLFTFGLGIALGLLLGLAEIKLPGGISLKLGIAGGPLIVGLLFGYLRRTGPIVWTMPYSSNVLLRQLGLILLLATIGVRSGGSFIESLQGGAGLTIFALGAGVSILTAMLTLLIGYKLLKIPYGIIMGYISNQPAILEFGLGRSKNMLPLQGYTIMFPIALILKIIYAQLLFLVL
ncbi:MAG TPA: TrkA C-terminal domain-containing protein [Saprospiraceae bacterium]|nr:TrkA C-terminal domain-containing protein [Saprospiraceae bacterium]